MISVGQRIQEAIDHVGRGDYALALTPACIALDITSQRHFGAKRSGRTIYKRFIQEHLWLITYMGFPGLMATTVRIPFSHPEVKADAAGNIGVEDVVYHVIRCSLVHSDDKSARVTWNNAISLGIDPSGNLSLNPQLIWGLIGAVVFSPANKDESIPDQYWLRIADFKMFISELWGRIDITKRVVKHYTGVSIP
jgi:hypothetical protein